MLPLVAPPADNIVLFDNIVPPELIVVLFACPPHFEDIPNIYSYSAPPASKAIGALSMRPPPPQYIYRGVWQVQFDVEAEAAMAPIQCLYAKYEKT